MNEIMDDGFHIDTAIEIETSDDTVNGVSRGYADVLTGATKAFERIVPMWLLYSATVMKYLQ